MPVGPPYTAATAPKPFLRIPPFPGTNSRYFTELDTSGAETFDLAAPLTRLRVGGSFWAAQPSLPLGCALVRLPWAAEAAREIAGARHIIVWSDSDTAADPVSGCSMVEGECDPWHMVEQASLLVAEPQDELCLIAALSGVPVYTPDPRTGAFSRQAISSAELIRRVIPNGYVNPFTNEAMSPLEAVHLCGFWRDLIDSNRDVDGGLGFAFWKRRHVAPLLWRGCGEFRFLRSAHGVATEGTLAIWRSKAAVHTLAELERGGVPIAEVEDGFLRSQGLGADCIPPLSITVDRLGAHFDPSQPSQLEQLLEDGQFDEDLLARARDLRAVIVENALGKYDRGGEQLDRPAGPRHHILVPGQVEDDRAVQVGGCGLVSNLDLLKRVRERAPDAYVLYKPHPDVLAGHRRGVIPERLCLQYADEIVGELPIASLIDMADEVHVNTSLAGFEALLRGTPVITHGVPFYAGWGLTTDLGPVPSRRTAKRSLDELVAATLLLYPRYLDPITGLPCPAEVVVARLNASEQVSPRLLVRMRRFQGKLMRCLGMVK